MSLAELISIKAEFQSVIGSAIPAIVNVLQDTCKGLQKDCICILSELSEHGK